MYSRAAFMGEEVFKLQLLGSCASSALFILFLAFRPQIVLKLFQDKNDRERNTEISTVTNTWLSSCYNKLGFLTFALIQSTNKT